MEFNKSIRNIVNLQLSTSKVNLRIIFNDIRNVIERSSARETTMRVALGSVCRKLLEKFNIHVGSYVSSIYTAKDMKDYSVISPLKMNEIADASQTRSLDKTVEKVEKLIKREIK